MSCLDAAEPRRIVTGLITDTAGQPLAGAVVSLGPEHFATTDDEGSFALRDLPLETDAPLTAAALGYTAWSLDTQTLTRFTARLRPRRQSPPRTGEISVELTLPQQPTVERPMVLSLDNGEIIPFRVPAGFIRYNLLISAPVGARTLNILAPSPDGVASPLWAPPTKALVSEGVTTALVVPLISPPPPALSFTIQPISPDQTGPVNIDTLEVALTCSSGGEGTSALAARAVVPFSTQPLLLPLFLPPNPVSCDLVLSFTSYNAQDQPSHHVAFLLDLLPDELPDATIPLQLPARRDLVPASSGPGLLSWPQLPDDDLYDVYIAPDLRDRLAPPLWSCTTAAAAIDLPQLPAQTLEVLDYDPGQDYAVRIVSRMVPGLSIEDNWDWSGYYGYVVSPWTPLEPELIRHWQPPQ